jgi:hypothetical protein
MCNMVHITKNRRWGYLIVMQSRSFIDGNAPSSLDELLQVLFVTVIIIE